MTDRQQEFEQQLAELQRGYRARLPQRVAAIALAWNRLRESPGTGAPAMDLQRLAHNLAGSGTAFGFPAVSKAARDLETAIEAWPDAGDWTVEEALAALHGIVTELVGQDAGSAAAVAGVVKPGPAQDLVLMADPGSEPCRELVAQLGHYGYRIEQVQDSAALEQRLAEEPPAALIVDMSHGRGKCSGIEQVVHLQESGVALPPVFYLSDREDARTRLAGVRAGGAGFFIKPVDAIDLAAALERLVPHETPEPGRVLIVDDDTVLAARHALVLEQAGMHTRVVNDPLRAPEELADFHPDLVLMELYMPECDGLELAAIIRQQEAYVGTSIVFLSSDTDTSLHLHALRAGGDDYLVKPMPPERLVASVAARVQRARTLNAFMARDSLTGLYNHSRIEEQFLRELARAHRLGTPFAYAFIDLDHFKQVNDVYGHAAGDRVLMSLARLLVHRLRRTDLVGRYGGEEFIVVLPDTDWEQAVSIIDELRENFAGIRHQIAGSEFRVTFSAGVAGFPTFSDAVALARAADQALYTAKRTGRNRVVRAPLPRHG